jgi:hypothetical protein
VVLAGVLVLGAPGSASARPFTAGPMLSASGESGAGELGKSIAISSDGTTAVVGAPLDESGAGAVFVYTRSGSGWTQDGPKLTGSDELGAGHFGASVAISADGTSVLVGGPRSGTGSGAVWTFRRSGASVTQEGGPLTGPGEEGAGEFGASVALSADGDEAFVGGPGDDARTGAVWAFVKEGGEWSAQGGKLVSSHAAAGAETGTSVALSAPRGRPAKARSTRSLAKGRTGARGRRWSTRAKQPPTAISARPSQSPAKGPQRSWVLRKRMCRRWKRTKKPKLVVWRGPSSGTAPAGRARNSWKPSTAAKTSTSANTSG